MKRLALLCLLIASPAFAEWPYVDPVTPGDYIERMVPKCPCDGSGFSYQFTISVKTCTRFEDVWAKTEGGTPIPLQFREEGTPGEAGYVFEAHNSDYNGTLLFHARVVDVCPKVG